MEEEKWWAGEDRAPTLRPLLVRGQGNEICRKPKGIRKFCETLSHGCTANMICASLRSGGRRLAVRTVMEHPIGALPRTPFASSRRSPQGETRDMREKTASHILHVPFRWFPPFGGWRHHLSPASGGTITRAYCRAAYEERPQGVLFFPLNRGGKGTRVTPANIF